MNFLAHYYLDRHATDSLFVIGLVTPDLVSIYDRTVRFREREIMQKVEGQVLSLEEKSLLLGIKRHFEADGIFHDSAFFKDQSAYLADSLRRSFPDYHVSRSFFVAHVLLELCLDRLLMQEYPYLADEFYAHFRKVNLLEVEKMTARFSPQSLPGFSEHLQRFVEWPYLSQYHDVNYIVRVLKRILTLVGLKPEEYLYLDDPEFGPCLEQCETGLKPIFLEAMEAIRQQLKPLVNISAH